MDLPRKVLWEKVQGLHWFQTYNISYGYDYLGNLVSETLPSGKVIRTDIDDAGRVAGVYKQGGSYCAGASRPETRSEDERRVPVLSI